MNYTFSVFSISLLLSAGISLVLAISIFKQHAGSARISLSLLMVAAAEWSLTSFLVVIARSEAFKIIWSTLGFLGVTATPVLFFIFALEFLTQQNWLRWKKSFLLWVIPILTILIAITNAWTGWLWDRFTLIPETKILVFHPGPYSWFATSYSYLLTLAGIIFLIRAVVIFRGGYRSQAAITLVAALFPILANLTYQLDQTFITGLDLTPYAFVLTGIVLAWSIQHFQYLNPLPVARDELVEFMGDAVIVLNNQSQVTYLNPAACRLIHVSLDQAVGKPASQLLQNWSEFTAPIDQQSAALSKPIELLGKDECWYEVRTLHLKNRRGRVSGSLIVIHDFTERKLSELNQARLANGLQTVAQVSTAVAATLDTQKLLQIVVNLTRERFNLYHAQIYIFESGDRNLTLATGAEPVGPILISQGERISLDRDSSLVARSARTNQGIISNNVSLDPGFSAQPLLPEIRSEMAVPISSNERLFGVLHVQDNHVGRFTQQDLDIMDSLAAQIAVALHNADTFTQLQTLLDTQHKELSLLYTLGSKTSEAPSIKELLEWTAEQIPQALKHPSACTLSISFEGEVFGKTPEMQVVNQLSQDIMLAGEVKGKICASYEKPITFLPEEQSLLSNVAQRLQNYIGELTLRDNQGQLREALHIARMGHFELDLNSNILTLNDEFYDLIGSNAIEQHGYHVPLVSLKKYFFHEDFHQAKLDFREIVNSPGLPFFEREYRFFRFESSKRTTRHAIIRARVHRDDQGKAISLTGTIQDITERVKVDAEIRRLATVIEQAKEAVVITDLKGNILYANPFFETVTGYPVLEVLGTNPRFLKSGQHDTVFYDILWNTISRGETWNGTFINRRKDGSVYYESATIFPIKDAAGTLINYATVKRDISAQVAAEQDVRLFARQQALLIDLTKAALEQTDFVSMLNILAKRLGELYAADGSYITLWDEQRGLPIPVAAYGSLSDVYSGLSAEPGAKTLTGSVLETGRSIAVDDVFDTPYISPSVSALFPTRSALGLPLVASGKKLGAVMITFIRSHHFTQAEITQGEQAASQIALALLKGELLEEEKKQRHLAERLQETGRILSTTLDIEHLLDLILDQIQDIVPYDLGSLLLLEGNMARVVRSRLAESLPVNPPISQDGSHSINILEDKNYSEIIKTLRVVITDDVHKDPGGVDPNLTASIHSWIGAPIIAREEVIGFLSLANTAAGYYKQEHATRLEAFAGQVSLALQNARLLETAQRNAKESETLRQAASAITRSLKLEETIDIILEQLNLVIPYDSASVLFLHDNELEIVGGHGFPDPNEVLGIKFSLDGDNPCALVYSSRQTQILEDAPKMYQSFTEPPHDRIHSWLGVPLIVQGRVTGMIALDSVKTGTFTQDHARMAAAFADQVAIALENARLFAQTQELAITDPLTGLYNRRFFFNQARTEFERARRYQGLLSIIMLDIDDFKKINDTYGHLIGDQVLQALAKLCRENVREIDVVGRYGGEEFVILLPETPLVVTPPITSEQNTELTEASLNSGAITAAERLRTIVSQSPIQTDKVTIRITISLGVAEYQSEISSPEMLLDQADQALYRAKQAGKNRVEIFGKE